MLLRPATQTISNSACRPNWNWEPPGTTSHRSRWTRIERKQLSWERRVNTLGCERQFWASQHGRRQLFDLGGSVEARKRTHGQQFNKNPKQHKHEKWLRQIVLMASHKHHRDSEGDEGDEEWLAQSWCSEIRSLFQTSGNGCRKERCVIFNEELHG